MTYRQANKNRYTRSCRALALVEALAIEAGYTVKGNDKIGIDVFLDDVDKSGGFYQWMNSLIEDEPYVTHDGIVIY